MPRFTFRQEVAAAFAAMFCSAVFVISAVGPGTNGATFI